MNLDISGLGHAIVDLQFKIDKTFVEELTKLEINFGSMTLKNVEGQKELLDLLKNRFNPPLRACGGSATNSIIAAASFGAKCHYACKVSDDDLGRFYKENLIENGIQNNILLESSEIPSGQSVIMVTPDAERTMCTCLGISESLSKDNLDVEGISNSKFILIEGYLVTSPSAFEACLEVITIAKKSETSVAFSLSDFNIVSAFHDQINQILAAGVDIIFCNEAEAMAFTKKDHIKEAETEIRNYAEQVYITKGSKGASVCLDKELSYIDGYKVNAIDTNGAGDMFAGSVLYKLSQGTEPREATRFGCFAASKTVENFGPRLSDNAYQDIKVHFK